MSAGRRRRRFRHGLIVFYSLFLTIASTVFCIVVLTKSKTVILDDWAVVMQRRVSDIPDVVEILDSRWGSAELAQSQLVFELDSLFKRVPPYQGDLHKGPDSDFRMLGKITYISGKNVALALGEVLWLDETPYYSKGSEDELAGILRLMRKQVYNVQNLANMLVNAKRVTVHDNKGASLALSAQQRATFDPPLREAIVLQGTDDIQYLLQETGQAAYRIELKLSDQPEDVVLLLVYANGYIQVSDMTSARGVLLHLSGDLFSYCRDLFNIRH